MNATKMDATKIDVNLALSKLAEARTEAALAEFVSMGPDAIALIRSGLGNRNWKVRRDCLRFFDHYLDRESAQLVLACLGDEHPDVRRWAAHALGCDHCKKGADFGFDSVPPLIKVALNDPNVRVRRSAVVVLAWSYPVDDRVRSLLTELLESESDYKIRLHAQSGLARH
jgi:HEAT repeat protein